MEEAILLPSEDQLGAAHLEFCFGDAAFRCHLVSPKFLYRTLQYLECPNIATNRQDLLRQLFHGDLQAQTLHDRLLRF